MREALCECRAIDGDSLSRAHIHAYIHAYIIHTRGHTRMYTRSMRTYNYGAVRNGTRARARAMVVLSTTVVVPSTLLCISRVCPPLRSDDREISVESSYAL